MSNRTAATLRENLESPDRQIEQGLRTRLAILLEDIERSEVSETMSGILVMQAFGIDENAFMAEHKAGIEALREMAPSIAFETIDRMVEEHFQSHLAEYIDLTNPAGASFTAEAIAEMTSIPPLSKIDEHDEEYSVWVDILSRMSNLKQLLVSQYIESLDDEDPRMNKIGQVEYLHFGEISQAMNRFFREWNRDAANLMDSETRTERGFTDELATIGRDEATDELREMKWSEVFPAEIAGVVDSYRNLVTALEGLREECIPEDQNLLQAKIDYYTALANAYESGDLDDFRRADTLLPGQNQGRLDVPVHIHTIESTYWKDRIQRLPDASIRFADEKGKRVNELAMRTRGDMVRELRRMLAEGYYPEGTLATIGQVEGATYIATHFMGSGTELAFPPSGQILPNEVESRIAGGINATCNVISTKKRLGARLKSARAVFGDEVGYAIADPANCDLDAMLGVGVASHEFGHAVGLTADTLVRIDSTLLHTHAEEWKATIGGLVLALKRTYESGEGEITLDDLKGTLVSQAVSAARYASMRNNAYAAAYLRHSMMICKVMEDEGVLVVEGDDWKIDVSDDAKVLAVFEKFEEQYKDLLGIYARGTTDDLKTFLADALQPTSFMEFVFRKLDESPEFELDGAPGMEELCAA